MKKLMARRANYFARSLRNNCASFPRFLIPFANLQSLYFPICNLSFLFTLVYTLRWGHNRPTLPIKRKLYCEIRKQEGLDLVFVLCVHLSSHQTKKKERKKVNFHCYPFHQTHRGSPISWAETCQPGSYKPGHL